MATTTAAAAPASPSQSTAAVHKQPPQRRSNNATAMWRAIRKFAAVRLLTKKTTATATSAASGSASYEERERERLRRLHVSPHAAHPLEKAEVLTAASHLTHSPMSSVERAQEARGARSDLASHDSFNSLSSAGSSNSLRRPKTADRTGSAGSSGGTTSGHSSKSVTPRFGIRRLVRKFALVNRLSKKHGGGGRHRRSESVDAAGDPNNSSLPHSFPGLVLDDDIDSPKRRHRQELARRHMELSLIHI